MWPGYWENALFNFILSNIPTQMLWKTCPEISKFLENGCVCVIKKAKKKIKVLFHVVCDGIRHCSYKWRNASVLFPPDDANWNRTGMVCAVVKTIVIPLPIVSDPRQLNEGLLRAWQVPIIRSFYSLCNTALRTRWLSVTYSSTETIS